MNGGNDDDTITNSNTGTLVTVVGGKGDDSIVNNNGTNVLFKYANGDGNDIIEGFNKTSTLQISGGSGTYSTIRKGSDIIVTVGEGKITLVGAAKISSSVHIEGQQVMVATTLNVTDKTKSPVTVGSAIKTINALSRTEAVKITGNALANSIVGGSGSDTLYGGAGNDSIAGNAGNDKLYGEKGNDFLKGGAGADLLYGGDGNDTLDGGEGNDTLTGNKGKDVFICNGGNDIITDYKEEDKIKITYGKANPMTSGNDVIFTVGLNKITVTGGKDKIISYVDKDGEHIYSDSESDVSINSDLTAIKLLESYYQDSFNVTDYSDALRTINGSAVGHDIEITGNKFMNSIIGGDGNDTLIGDKGNDTLTGGEGSDVFVYNNGDGNDIITDYDEEDIIQIESGTVKKIFSSGSDVIFTVGNNKITVKGGANKIIRYDDAAGIEHFYPVNFNAAGTAATLSSDYNKDTFNTTDYGDYAGIIKTIQASEVTHALTIMANKEANRIIGSEENDWINGVAGKDTIFGGDGNDTLIGGTGNDSLTGGNGSDVFLYKSGDGDDVIVDYAEEDKIKITSGAIKSVKKSNKDVIFTIDNGEITVKGAATKTVTYIDASGNTKYFPTTPSSSIIWTDSKKTAILRDTYSKTSFIASDYSNSIKKIDASSVIHDLSITGNGKANLILGGEENDTIIGGKSNDTLQGGTGADVFVYANGDGKDIILDYAEEDTIKITSGTPKITKSGFDVVFTVGSGKITVRNAANKTVTYLDAGDNKKTYGSAPLFVEDDTDYELTPNLSSIVQSKAADYSFLNVSSKLTKETNLIAYSGKR